MFVFNERVHSAHFDEVLKKGKMLHSPFFSLCFLEEEAKAFAVVASKKVSKKAVIRNRNKRRVRHALKEISKNLPSGAYVVFIKRDLSVIPYPEINKEIITLLDRVCML